MNKSVGSWVLLLVAAGGCQTVDEAQSVTDVSGALSAAPIELIAIGTLDASGPDLASQTAGALENGVAGNLLGGLGSGIAHAGGTKFLSVPDRGPNAVAYDSAIDDTTSYIVRFQTLKLKLKPSAASSALPFEIAPKLKDTTLLSSKDSLVYSSGVGLGVGNGAPALNDKKHFYFSGRSDNFDPTKPSTDAKNARFDPESIRVAPDGKSVFISDEYGPHIYQFDRSSGRRIAVIALPASFAAANSSPQGALEISGNSSGRVSNKGMEGLAITPDGSALVGVMQSPLIQDGGTDAAYTRLIRIELATGNSAQYAYPLTNIGTPEKPKYPTISDIVAVNDHEFLVDERDGKGLGDNSTAAFKQIQHIDLNGAADVSGLSGAANLASKAISKTTLIDVVAVLNAHGVASQDIPAKLEGLAFGKDLSVDGEIKHVLYLSNDNDFLSTITDTNHPNGLANPNRFYVFAIDESVLPGYVAQSHSKEDEADDAD